MKVKVLHIIDSLRHGGAETVAVNTFNVQNDDESKCVEAFICATRMEGGLLKQLKRSDRYIFLNRKSTFDYKAISKLIQFIDKHDIMIIHAHTTSFFIAVLVKLRRPKLKVVWHNHTGANIHAKGKRKLFLKFCSKFFNGVINVNEPLNHWTKSVLGKKNSTIINNFAIFTVQDEITKLNGTFESNIVCVAGLREVKDHITLLEAFKKVCHENNDVGLHLIGNDYEDDYSKRIKDFIDHNNLGSNVFLYGNCKDIKYILSQASIGVISSKFEGLPIALIEYGLAKLPVVCTNVGDCNKVVIHNKNGLLVEKEQPETMAKALLSLVKSNHADQYAIALNEFINNSYAVDQYIEKLNQFYKKL